MTWPRTSMKSVGRVGSSQIGVVRPHGLDPLAQHLRSHDERQAGRDRQNRADCDKKPAR